MEELTKENYITNHDYLSYSTLSRFINCEAAVVAKYHPPVTESLLVGSYVDAHFSGELEQFKQDHPEIFNSRTGELKKDYQKADDIIKRIEQDETMMLFMSGEKQRIMSGTINGVPFKIKMDSYKENEFIADLKIIKDFSNVWSDAFGSYQSFVLAYNYDIEMAIFQEVVFQNTGKRLPCYLVCATKEDPSDVAILEIPQDILDKALEIVKNNLPRYKEVMDGKEAPCRCEKCAYCRQTKKARIIDFSFANYNGAKLREEGFECIDPIKKEDK